MSLEKIAAISNKMGSDKACVLAGGGNTSFKDSRHLYIKPSGVPLAVIKEDDFVKMDRSLIRECIRSTEAVAPSEREALSKRAVDFAVLASKNGRRPSVEAPLHELFDQTYVVHLHPTLVNAMTCGKNGKEICAKLFPKAMWMGVTNPGATLAVEAEKTFDAFKKSAGFAPNVVFLQNHGVFVAADSTEEIESIYADMFAKLQDYCKTQNVCTCAADGPAFDPEFVHQNAPILRGLLTQNGVPGAVGVMNLLTLPEGPFTPDHIVYAKSYPLVTDTITRDAIDGYKAKYGFLPMMVLVPGKALFACGKDVKAMRTAMEFIQDSASICKLSQAFGGPSPLPDDARVFIETWEMESYRQKVAFGGGAGQLSGKIALVTGGAQGFGYGISQSLVEAGAHVIIADMNIQGAEDAAKTLGNATAAAVNISDESSVAGLANWVAEKFGGLDLFVANAGVLRAGSVKIFEKKDWDFVTNINYTGYFLCVKHFANLMAIQNKYSGLWSDIVQVNSKSGLVGSNKNAAYAAGKFGTIGMTQSFALELVTDHIKVNSVCPGNYYDGPLWSNPEKGLFKQYFDAGKVPGAKSVEDVKQHYLNQTPIKRGCFPADVARAIIYACTQQFETGQAIPVTGGQIMLN